MKRKTIMVIAGEASGDTLAAELVPHLRQAIIDAEAGLSTAAQPLLTTLQPCFFGAGGPRMAEAGVEVAIDLTAHSVTGIWEIAGKFLQFRRFFHQLLAQAIQRQPDLILCVDFGGFNLRFARAVRAYTHRRPGPFHNWQPRIVQFVSPQVWASREGRAKHIARDYDLLLSIFPFEKDWYARRAPGFHVEFVGHPMLDRYLATANGQRRQEEGATASPLSVLLLPGSRNGELKRHLPIMIQALALLRASLPDLRAAMVLPNQTLAQQARSFGLPPHLDLKIGGLPEALAASDVAIASTGTVIMECAFFGVPTVALYKVAWGTYQIARRLAKIRYLAMPNLLADQEVIPEFIQDAATPDNIARATLELLRDPARRFAIKARLDSIITSLGSPGASRRAAHAVAALLER